MRAVTALVSERRQHILRLQEYLQGRGEAVGPDAFVTRHHFAPGAYAREILLPAGSLVVGKIHRHAHVNVVSHGQCIVATPDGIREISAPFTFVSAPGTKRVVLAISDVVWTTVHVTDETDLAKIEAHVIAPDFAELAADERPQISAGGTA